MARRYRGTYPSSFSGGNASSSIDESTLLRGGRRLYGRAKTGLEDLAGNELDSEISVSSSTASTLSMYANATSTEISTSSLVSTTSYSSSRPNDPPGSDSKAGKKEETKKPVIANIILRKLIASRLRDVVGLNLDQDVRPYKDIVAKRMLHFGLRRVVGPFEFYLEFANMPESRQYSNWFPKMQSFYQDLTNREKLPVFKNVVIPGRCYVCLDFTDGKWHRVRVHALRRRSKVSVFYLDLCKMQETQVGNLLELHSDFAKVPYQVFRCYLYDIRPVDNGGTYDWCPEACRYFTDLVNKKQFTGVVLTRSDTIVTNGLPDFITTIGVVLVENEPGTSRPMPNVCTLNAQMVDAGFAVATGVTAGCHHVPFIKRDMPNFDLSDFLSAHRTLSVQQRALPVQPEHGEAIQITLQDFTELPVEVPIAVPKSLTMMTPNGLCFEEAERIGIQAYYKNTTNYLPLEIRCRLAHVNMVYVQSPGYLILHLQSKLKDLDAMHDGLRMVVENEQPLANGYPGSFVACHILDSIGQDKERSFWCRGLIKTVGRGEEDTAVYKIFLVDYGNEVTVSSLFVRLLPPYFQDIPSYAIRVHLDVENLVPIEGSSWSVSAIMNFRKYVFAWEGKGPVYYIYRPRKSEVLQLEHFNQPIIYNSSEGNWIVGYGRKTEGHRVINEKRDHPMIRNLFISTGVELCYEVMLSTGSFWHFESISDTLLEDGNAAIVELKKGTNRTHLDITDEATSNSNEIERDEGSRKSRADTTKNEEFFGHRNVGSESSRSMTIMACEPKSNANNKMTEEYRWK